MNDLPRVFANKINNNLNNTQEIFYGNDRLETQNSIDVIKKINNIFSSINHVYKSKVKIQFKDRVEEKIIVGKTSTKLIPHQ